MDTQIGTVKLEPPGAGAGAAASKMGRGFKLKTGVVGGGEGEKDMVWGGGPYRW